MNAEWSLEPRIGIWAGASVTQRQMVVVEYFLDSFTSGRVVHSRCKRVCLGLPGLHGRSPDLQRRSGQRRDEWYGRWKLRIQRYFWGPRSDLGWERIYANPSWPH